MTPPHLITPAVLKTKGDQIPRHLRRVVRPKRRHTHAHHTFVLVWAANASIQVSFLNSLPLSLYHAQSHSFSPSPNFLSPFTPPHHGLAACHHQHVCHPIDRFEVHNKRRVRGRTRQVRVIAAVVTEERGRIERERKGGREKKTWKESDKINQNRNKKFFKERKRQHPLDEHMKLELWNTLSDDPWFDEKFTDWPFHWPMTTYMLAHWGDEQKSWMLRRRRRRKGIRMGDGGGKKRERKGSEQERELVKR